MPLSLCLVPILVGVACLAFRRRVTLGRSLLAAGIVLLLLFSNKLVSRWLIRPLEVQYAAMPEFVGDAPPPAKLASCQFVVVLGAAHGYDPEHSANNLLSSSALARITEAVRLLRVLPRATLIVSGPGIANRETHAAVLGRAAQALGIAANRIRYIDHARDTEEESYAVQRLVGGAPVALVTSAWHMPRSMALLRGAGVTAVACPTDFLSHADDAFRATDLLWDAGALERSTWAVRERIGQLWLWLRGKM